MTEKFRTESDSMGEFQVPIDAKFGASTARATDNFPISNLRFSRVFIRSLGEIKKACAVVNEKNNLIDSKLSKAIVDSAQEVIDGKQDKEKNTLKTKVFVVKLMCKRILKRLLF